MRLAAPPDDDSLEEPAAMPSTKSYKLLHEQVTARPGAEERLAALRKATLQEISRYEQRQASSQP